MEDDLQKLRDDLRRLRFLLGRTIDAQAARAIREMIEEVEVRIGMLEQGAMDARPRNGGQRSATH